MSQNMIERTTVRLPEGLLERSRRKAAAEGRTLTSLIEEGLRLILDGGGKPARRRRVLPRVSTADGGLMPGIDLSNPSALQETDDMDYIRRMQRPA
jgi:hypothetical protein